MLKGKYTKITSPNEIAPYERHFCYFVLEYHTTTNVFPTSKQRNTQDSLGLFLAMNRAHRPKA